MLYHSIEFWAFLGAAAGLYSLCPHAWRPWYLFATSFVFYCTWSIPFAFLLLVEAGVAYVVAQRIGDAATDEERRGWLYAGFALLLLPLISLKYSSWFSDLAALVVGDRPWTASLAAISLLAPVGISYYTLKLVSYVLDVHLGRLQPCRRFPLVATYAAFFPQILAGPIQRAGDFLDEAEKPQPVKAGLAASGVRLILFGLFKKLVLADRLGLIVDEIFARPDSFSAPILVLGSYLFVIQLYADFSGLTDVAIGVGRLFGIQAPQNFDAPLFARTIPEFWRRWHITLTSWLTDYVFTPLQIRLRDLGRIGLSISLMINMLGVAVWHGAQWKFVVFGVIHGCYLVGSALTMPLRRRLYRATGWNRAHEVTGPLITFHLFAAALIVFRANTLEDAWFIYQRIGEMLSEAILGGGGVAVGTVSDAIASKWHAEDTWIAAGAFLLMETVHLLRRQGRSVSEVLLMPAWLRLGSCYALGLAILLWGQSETRQFIYAQF